MTQYTSFNASTSKQEATALVLGATGATGKYVVRYFLEKEYTVKAVVRSAEKMQSLLSSMEGFEFDKKKLILKEASVLDLTEQELLELLNGCQSVVSCLGHNMTFSGIFGHPRNLVVEALKKTCEAIIKMKAETKSSEDSGKMKLVLMGTVGVPHPEGSDNIRTLSERFLLRCLHYTLPPHSDNEMATEYLYKTIGKSHKSLEWSIVRPDDLLDGDGTKYEVSKKPGGSLFGGDTKTTRANAAQFMVDLIINKDLWSKWVFDLPVVTDFLPESASVVTDLVPESD